MAHDPDEGGAFVFDLVDDDGHLPPASPDLDTAAGDPDGYGPESDEAVAGGPLPHGVLGWRLRGLAPVAGVLAVVLGTGFAVDGVRDAARIERISQAPGGVVDVSAPLEEVWTWTETAGFEDVTPWYLVADLEGVLAFRFEEELIGLDPASGEQAWSVPLGEDPDCGPVGHPGYQGSAGLATSSLVCLQGVGADRNAITVGPGGATSEPRILDAADDRRYGTAHPGPDGMLLRAQRIGPRSAIDVGDARCSATTGECSGTVEAGRDLQLHAEDAVTGEERWHVTIPFRATRAGDCTPWFGEPWDGWGEWDEAPAAQALAPDAFGVQLGTGLIEMWGCGTSAVVTPGGVLLEADGERGLGGVVSLGDLAQAGPETAVAATVSEHPPRTGLFGLDGELVREIAGRVQTPRATDDSDAPVLLGTDVAGYNLRSYTTDGTERWHVTDRDGSPEYLAQVAGIAVTSSWTGSVRGLDLATGAERWSWETGETENSETEDSESGENWYAERAFTDGRFVLLVLRSEEGMLGLASLDAASGELVWDRTAEEDYTLPLEVSLFSVGGHLLAVSPSGITGLG